MRTLAVVVLCTSATAHADETIVVTGLRLPRPIKDVPAAVTVIDRNELAQSPLRLTDEILRTLPSVGTFRRSSSLIADPTSQGLSLRGVGSSAVSRALVLRDGVPINDPFGGWVYWRAMSPLDIDRIEVAPSGSSALFGDFALGGVVQVLSRPIRRREAQAVIAGGTYDTGRAALRVADRLGGVGVALDGEAFHSGGYIPIAPYARGAVDGRASSTHGSAGIRAERSGAHISARWFQQALDAGTQHTSADVRSVNVSGGYKVGGLAVELFAADNLFRQERARVAPDRSSATIASQQRTPSQNQGALVTYTTPLRDHTILVGADARHVVGTATDMLADGERAAGGTQWFAGAFVEDALHLSDAIEIAAAMRIDAWQNRNGQLRTDAEVMNLATRSELQLDPRIGILGRVSDELALRASVYRAFRAPTLNELYRPFQVGTIFTAANENLRPETLWGAEAGPQIVVSNIVVRATGFYNHLADAIGNVTVGDMQRMRMNFGTARIAGVELDASWRPNPTWTFAVAETFMDATANNKRLAQTPRHRATASVTYTGVVSATTQVRYLGTQFEDDLNTQPMGAVVLVDARIAREVGHGITGFVAAENLFDRRYLVGRAGIDTFGAPRTLELGVALDMH